MASKTKKDEIFSRGRELLARKDFQRALELFNMFLSREADFTLTAPERLMALDHRAVTFTKLGDNLSALEDGRRMIKVVKGDSQGYLRTGTVCELLQRHEMALGVYKYGLANVLPSEPNFELLRTRHDLIVRKCNIVDPLQFLPLDLVELIFQHLSFPNLTQILRVSWLWCATLTALPGLWTHLDLASAHRPVSLNTVRHYMRRSREGVTRASLSVSKMNGDEILRHISMQCGALKHLDINGAAGQTGPNLLQSIPFFTELQALVISLDLAVSLKTVSKLLGSCVNLTRAEFHHVHGSTDSSEWTSGISGIRSLTINADPKATKPMPLDTLTQIFKSIPEVEYFRFNRWGFDPEEMDFTMLQNLQNLDLAGSNLRMLPNLPESIQILNLSRCRLSPVSFPPAAFANGMKSVRLPNLKALLVSQMSHLRIQWLMRLLAANQTNLTALNLRHCSSLTGKDIISLIHDGYFQAITDLSLAGCNVSDETAKLLALASPGLTNLDLDGTQLSGVGVKALVLKPGRKLEKLKLNNCTRISKDAIDFARVHDINVEFGLFEELKPKGSRQIRIT